MPPTRALRSHAIAGSGQDANSPTRTGRLTRGADPAPPSVTVSRSAPTSPPGSRSIRLTVKMSSSKLRQVANSRNSRATTSARHNIFTENPVVHGKRSSRNNKNLKEISEDEDDDDDDDDDDVDVDDDDDDEQDEEDEEEIGDSEDDAAEDEELDADGDLDMDDQTPRPAVSRRNAARQPAAATSKAKPLKSVEQKEMELADDDDELSELESDADAEPDDTMLQDEEMGEAGEEDEDEDEEEVGIEEEEDNDDGLGSDDDSALDLTKLTKRQRGSLGTDFLQLPMEPQVKKHLTAEEHAMRRAEMARRRKNLSEKRNEEEKMDTINRLLKKQAPKRRGRVPVTELGGESTPDVAAEFEKPDETVIRWISNRDGCKVAVPAEMLGAPASRPFGGFTGIGSSGRKLIEEV